MIPDDELEAWLMNARTGYNTRAVVEAVERMVAEIRMVRADNDEAHALLTKLGALLTGTADALKGPPPPLTRHDWSDLPTVAAKMRAGRDEARDRLARLQSTSATVTHSRLDRDLLARRLAEAERERDEARRIAADEAQAYDECAAALVELQRTVATAVEQLRADPGAAEWVCAVLEMAVKGGEGNG